MYQCIIVSLSLTAIHLSPGCRPFEAFNWAPAAERDEDVLRPQVAFTAPRLLLHTRRLWAAGVLADATAVFDMRAAGAMADALSRVAASSSGGSAGALLLGAELASSATMSAGGTTGEAPAADAFFSTPRVADAAAVAAASAFSTDWDVIVSARKRVQQRNGDSGSATASLVDSLLSAVYDAAPPQSGAAQPPSLLPLPIKPLVTGEQELAGYDGYCPSHFTTPRHRRALSQVANKLVVWQLRLNGEGSRDIVGGGRDSSAWLRDSGAETAVLFHHDVGSVQRKRAATAGAAEGGGSQSHALTTTGSGGERVSGTDAAAALLLRESTTSLPAKQESRTRFLAGRNSFPHSFVLPAAHGSIAHLLSTAPISVVHASTLALPHGLLVADTHGVRYIIASFSDSSKSGSGGGGGVSAAVEDNEAAVVASLVRQYAPFLPLVVTGRCGAGSHAEHADAAQQEQQQSAAAAAPDVHRHSGVAARRRAASGGNSSRSSGAMCDDRSRARAAVAGRTSAAAAAKLYCASRATAALWAAGLRPLPAVLTNTHAHAAAAAAHDAAAGAAAAVVADAASSSVDAAAADNAGALDADCEDGSVDDAAPVTDTSAAAANAGVHGSSINGHADHGVAFVFVNRAFLDATAAGSALCTLRHVGTTSAEHDHDPLLCRWRNV